MNKKTVLVVDSNADWYVAALAKTCPQFQYISAPSEDVALAHAGEAEILVGLAPALSSALISGMDRLEWIQALTTGVDNLLTMSELAPGVALTNSRGFHGPQMSELAILFMLALSRQFPKMIANQQTATWERWTQPLLFNKTVCLLGLGAIAEALAKRCAAFEMTVTGVSDSRRQAEGFARIYRRSDLGQAAAECDFLIVIVPYSPKTHHIVNGDILNRMKSGAFLINIARGGCVDEVALLAALQSGQIAGAGLDVFETEPLPDGSAIWSAPNIVLTPHIGGMADIYKQQALPSVVRNLEAFAEGGRAALESCISR